MRRALFICLLGACGVDGVPVAPVPADLSDPVCPSTMDRVEAACSIDLDCQAKKSGSECLQGICCIDRRPSDGGMP